MKQKEILSLIEHYAKTGIIKKPLIPYYDQNGRWRGETIQPRLKIPENLNSLMTQSQLPTHRIVNHELNGDILHTSYVSRSKESAKIEYVEIQGSLMVDSDEPICAPNLQHVAYHLVSPTSAKVDLPNLGYVGGDIILTACRELNLPLLRKIKGNMSIVGDLPPELVSVRGRLGLYGRQSYIAKNLKRVGGSLIVLGARNVTAPALEKIGGGLLCTGYTFIVRAPQLKSIGGDLLVQVATELDLYSLRNVGGDMNTSCADQFYDPDIKLGGVWAIAPDAMMNWAKRKQALELLRKRETPYL